MPDNSFVIDKRDISFNLWEYLELEKILDSERFAEFDRQSIEIMLEEAFKLSAENFAPVDAEGDRVGCVLENGHVKIPACYHEPYRKFCENGWMGLTASPEYGGFGAPMLVYAATTEAAVGACMPMVMYLGLTGGAANLIAEFCDDATKNAYLHKMYAGQWGGTMCLTEAGAGTAVGDLKTTARRQADGTYLIEGQKIFISSGESDLVENTIHLVLARTPDAPAGIKGISIFLVPQYLPDEAGEKGAFNDVKCIGIEHKMGIHGSSTCSMLFGDEGRCRAFLIGKECEGMKIMFHMMNEARQGVGFLSHGLAAAACNEALAYASERIQGTDLRDFKDVHAPRIPIIKHPDVRRMLLTMRAYTCAFRAILSKTCQLQDIIASSSDAAVRDKSQGLIDILTPVCKAYCSDYGFRVNELAVQVLGGYGYIQEFPLERRLRDQKITAIYEGTNGIQALDLLGRKLSMKGGMVYFSLLQDLTEFAASARGDAHVGELAVIFDAARERMQNVSMALASKGMMGDVLTPALAATDFLTVFGNVISAWLLIDHARLAGKRLDELVAERGAAEPAAFEKLLEDHPDAAFYYNKIVTAEFFVRHILSMNESLINTIEMADDSPMRYRF